MSRRTKPWGRLSTWRKSGRLATCPTVLVAHLQPEVQPLRPEVGLAKDRRRLGRSRQRPERRAQRHLSQVHDRVNLVSRPNDPTPVKEVVADVKPAVLARTAADVDTDLGDEGEFIAALPADVGRQGQAAARRGVAGPD